MIPDLTTSLGPLRLQTPLIAASGTVGSVVDFANTVDFAAYGAAVAKSVSPDPWPGLAPPRLAPAGTGMLNGIGIQNPGIEAWQAEYGPAIATAGVPVWGSAVAREPAGFAEVAIGLEAAGVAAVEVNLSCPNLDGDLFALNARASAAVVTRVRRATRLPVGAKLSPNAERVAEVARAVSEAGADWVVLTNTMLGAGIDTATRRPLLSGVIGGYSGPPLKPAALRCVWEVAATLPGVPIVGCGGVSTGSDVVEYLLAGAAAVAIGTAHFAEPRVGVRVRRELVAELKRSKARGITELIGAVETW